MVDDAGVHQMDVACLPQFTVTDLIFPITYHGTLRSRRVSTRTTTTSPLTYHVHLTCFVYLLTYLVLGAQFSQQAHCLTPVENAGIDINSFGRVAEGMISQQTAFVYPYRGQC